MRRDLIVWLVALIVLYLFSHFFLEPFNESETRSKMLKTNDMAKDALKEIEAQRQK